LNHFQNKYSIIQDVNEMEQKHERGMFLESLPKYIEYHYSTIQMKWDRNINIKIAWNELDDVLRKIGSGIAV